MASYGGSVRPSELSSRLLRCKAKAELAYLWHQLGSPNYSFEHLGLDYDYALWLVPKPGLTKGQILE